MLTLPFYMLWLQRWVDRGNSDGGWQAAETRGGKDPVQPHLQHRQHGGGGDGHLHYTPQKKGKNDTCTCMYFIPKVQKIFQPLCCFMSAHNFFHVIILQRVKTVLLKYLLWRHRWYLGTFTTTYIKNTFNNLPLAASSGSAVYYTPLCKGFM